MSFVRKYSKEVVLTVLILSNVFVWFSIYRSRPGEVLSVYFLDVGQGDAILIDSPTHGRVLVDGGKNRQVLTELGQVLPFGDRRIDVVLATHPDADHISGLPEVVSRYNVSAYIEPGVESDNTLDDELDKRIKAKSIPALIARRGMTINFGDGARLVVLFPNQDVSHWETNDASIVAKLVYGKESFLLTGDATIKTENILLNLNSTILKSSVLKVGHHGSRTSTSLGFAQAVSPEYAVISAGKDNRYGHPHVEVLTTLAKINSQILSTSEEGTIMFRTDGEGLEVN